MKKTYLKKLLLVLCLIFGLKEVQAQCTVTALASIGPNGVVSFTASALPATGNPVYSWFFPGAFNSVGPSSNTAFNATGYYTTNGTYTVNVVMMNGPLSCSATAMLVITVNTASITSASPCTMAVQYSSPTNTNTCNGSATVAAASNMCGTVTYAWSNGATGMVATGLCPSTSYTVTANSTSGVNCCSVSVGVVNIPASPPCNLVANFNTAQSINGLVNFNNTSVNASGGATYLWSFGDGSTSTSASPAHTYSANGSYTATLTVNNNVSPACTSTKVLTIFVNTYCTLNAGFTVSNVTSSSLQFLNTTTGIVGPVNYTWNFGDGSTGVGAGAYHSYTSTGTYTVMMIVSNSTVNASCIDTALAVVNINTLCVANASFSLVSSGTPQLWNAFPQFPSNVVGATWNWGDGTTSNTLFTSHTYSAAGNYSMCLTVTVSCGAVSIFCAGYNIYRSSDDNTIVTVNVVDPSQATGIKTTSGAGNMDYIISPNPNNGTFNLNLAGLPSGPIKVSVYNVVGQMVYSTLTDKTAYAFSKDIQLTETSGVYFIQVNSNNKTLTKKVVITK